MTETRYRLPHEVAAQLGISPSTLRRWSNEFADSLSDAAGRPEIAPTGGMAHRRYTDQDLETLMTTKGLLAEGLTYIQVGRRLELLRMRSAPAGEDLEGDEVQSMALGPTMQEASSFSPGVAVLADTLHTVADGQHLLLSTQQANRDLLTVLLQDNFGLKEENVKLRNRMLELERDLSEIRRQETARRDALEPRLQRLEEQARPVKSPAPSSSQRSGCASFFGLIS
jgi:DNA-binding transcriptional MerR regulator